MRTLAAVISAVSVLTAAPAFPAAASPAAASAVSCAGPRGDSSFTLDELAGLFSAELTADKTIYHIVWPCEKHNVFTLILTRKDIDAVTLTTQEAFYPTGWFDGDHLRMISRVRLYLNLREFSRMLTVKGDTIELHVSLYNVPLSNTRDYLSPASYSHARTLYTKLRRILRKSDKGRMLVLKNVQVDMVESPQYGYPASWKPESFFLDLRLYKPAALLYSGKTLSLPPRKAGAR